jgi:hypothetical protein
MLESAPELANKATRHLRRRVLRSSIILAAALASVPALGATSPEKAAATMRDLQAHFAACFQPPLEAEGTRITFYFSVKRDGEIYGEPRIGWLGFKGSPGERQHFLSAFLDTFEQCTPLQLTEDLARTIPGKVYYLQFKVGLQGSKGTEVVLRPYGSNGYPLVDVPEHW